MPADTFRGVLLDVDGTLVDSNDAHALAWVDAFAACDRDVAYGQIRSRIGMGGDHLIAELTGLPPTARAHAKLARLHGEYFRDRYLARVRPMLGSRAFVLQLARAGLAYVVATSSAADDLAALLAIADVADLCELAATADDAGASKPSPDILEAALAKLPHERARCVLVGDTPYDIRAARAANLAAVGVTCGGFPPEQLAGARAVYAGPADLVARWDGGRFA